jgi:hypothetical protein
MKRRNQKRLTKTGHTSPQPMPPVVVAAGISPRCQTTDPLPSKWGIFSSARPAIRAIFSLFKLASDRFCDDERCDNDDIQVRMYCDQLTDLYILDMLLHYCRIFPIHFILHPQLYTFQKIRANADNFLQRAKASGVIATGGAPERLVNLIQVRAVTLDNLGEYACMHRNKIMLSDMSLVGSYNLSTNARKNNWETMDLIATNPKALEAFDALWKKLADQQVNLLSPRKELFPPWEHREFDAWMVKLSSSKRQKTA